MDDPSRSRRGIRVSFLILLLIEILVLIAIDLASMWIAYGANAEPRSMTLVLLPRVLWISQITLAAMWLAAGQTPFFTRITLLALIAIGWAVLNAWPVWNEGRDVLREDIIGNLKETAFLAGCVAVPLFALRLLNLRLTASQKSSAPLPKAQFTIARLMVLTLAAAALLVLAREVFPTEGQSVGFHVVRTFVALVLGALAAQVIFTMRRRWLWLAIAFVVATLVAGIILVVLRLSPTRDHVRVHAPVFEVIVTINVYEAVMLLTLLPFRWAGYRFWPHVEGSVAEPAEPKLVEPRG